MIWIILISILLVLIHLHRVHRLLERVVHRLELTDQEKHLEDMAIDDPETYDGILESKYASRAEKRKNL